MLKISENTKLGRNISKNVCNTYLEVWETVKHFLENVDEFMEKIEQTIVNHCFKIGFVLTANPWTFFTFASTPLPRPSTKIRLHNHKIYVSCLSSTSFIISDTVDIRICQEVKAYLYVVQRLKIFIRMRSLSFLRRFRFEKNEQNGFPNTWTPNTN